MTWPILFVCIVILIALQGVEGSVWYAYGDSCYYVHESPLETYASAVDLCDSYEEAYIAELQTIEEFDYVRSPLIAGLEYWVGMIRVDGKFRWRLSESEALQEMWHDGEPNENSDCARLGYLFSEHKLADKSCSFYFSVICERPRSTMSKRYTLALLSGNADYENLCLINTAASYRSRVECGLFCERTDSCQAFLFTGNGGQTSCQLFRYDISCVTDLTDEELAKLYYLLPNSGCE